VNVFDVSPAAKFSTTGPANAISALPVHVAPTFAVPVPVFTETLEAPVVRPVLVTVTTVFCGVSPTVDSSFTKLAAENCIVFVGVAVGVAVGVFVGVAVGVAVGVGVGPTAPGTIA